MSRARSCVAAIEAGGTKIICALVDDADAVIACVRIVTTADAMTDLAECAAWIRRAAWEAGVRPRALGAAWFGPLDLAEGSLRQTPKPGWSDVRLVEKLGALTGLPVILRSDVGAAALAEARHGAAHGCRRSLYLTVGTGVGGGAVIDGHLLESSTHPEMGHVAMPAAPDGFAGICPFHGDCLEGRCSGPAILRRCGMPAERLPADHPGWAAIIDDLAAGLQSMVLVLAPDRVVLGGGVSQGGGMGALRFADLVGAALRRRVAGYAGIASARPGGVVPTALNGLAGVLGAALAARDVCETTEGVVGLPGCAAPSP